MMDVSRPPLYARTTCDALGFVGLGFYNCRVSVRVSSRRRDARVGDGGESATTRAPSLDGKGLGAIDITIAFFYPSALFGDRRRATRRRRAIDRDHDRSIRRSARARDASDAPS
jgi:hypothetical protein